MGNGGARAALDIGCTLHGAVSGPAARCRSRSGALPPANADTSRYGVVRDNVIGQTQ